MRVPAGFTVVAQPPFAVLGGEPPAQARLRTTNTVKWALDRLKQDYFPREPVEINDIWLFRDRTSYTNHVSRTTWGPPPQVWHRTILTSLADSKAAIFA
ncbi:MAG: hypothetical protein HY674_13405 [Chloroflexi bacterium]|nr:hypothetical protein [Chloroflexota bacterium]